MKKIYTFIFFAALFLHSITSQAVIIVVQVNMIGITINPAGVHVAGTFNSWNPNGPLMTELGGGIYEQAFTVPDNSVVQFKFINGANMSDGENVPAACAVGGNRSVNVGTENVLVGPYCFGQCGNCEISEPTTTTVTFKVDMTGEDAGNGVRIAGNFQNWDPAASVMNLATNSIYTFTATVPIGGTVLYKFINGNQWSEAETVPSACGESDGFGGFNRELIVGNTTLVLDPVCFGSCTSCSPIAVDDAYNTAGLQVYPNPASTTVHMNFASMPKEFHVCDMQGNIVWKERLVKSETEVDTTPWTSGVYIVRVVYTDHIEIKRLIVE
jgi:hypothetical protein